ncbi:Fork-head domain-containing protein [Entamoeba marina]
MQQSSKTPCRCLLCVEFGDIVLNQKRLAWTTLCRLSFLSMNTANPSDFINVRDLFIFITNHWDVLGHLEQLKKKMWKKSILDALNHSDFFQSGISQYHTNGYWKLLDITRPNIKTRKEKLKEKPKQPVETVKSTTPQIKPEVDARPVYKELPLEPTYVIPKFSNDYYYPHYDSYHDPYYDLYPRTFQYRPSDYDYYSEYSHYQHPLS